MEVAAIDPRAAALTEAIRRYVQDGWRIESQTGYDVVLVRGHRVNHILHLLITVLLLGLWLIVWVPLAMFGGEKRKLLWVDEQGRVVERSAYS